MSGSPPWLIPVAASCVLSGLAGYYIGSSTSYPVGPRQSRSLDESDGDSDGEDTETSDFSDHAEVSKLVLVIRNDLKMGKGKVAAQCSHATLACYKSIARTNPALLARWEATGQAKVTLQCNDETEMELLQAMAMSLKLTAKVIHDAGRTQVAAGSATVLGIGPAPKSVIDQVTGSLRLY